MSQQPTIVWKDLVGNEYEFELFPKNTKHVETFPSLYIYAKHVSRNKWDILWVGKSNDVNRRLEEHESNHEPFIKEATHIQFRVNRISVRRDREEKALIKALRPKYNKQGLS